MIYIRANHHYFSLILIKNCSLTYHGDLSHHFVKLWVTTVLQNKSRVLITEFPGSSFTINELISIVRDSLNLTNLMNLWFNIHVVCINICPVIQFGSNLVLLKTTSPDRKPFIPKTISKHISKRFHRIKKNSKAVYLSFTSEYLHISYIKFCVCGFNAITQGKIIGISNS